MASTQAPSRIRPTPLLSRCRRPWTGWVQVLAAVMMILSPLPSSWASWSDTDSDGSNDTWTDPVTSQATTLADLNLQNTDADSDGATNDEEAAEGSDPFSYDTDLDGLSDGDELHIVRPILGVSLTNWDTSGNEVSDYDEWHNFSGVTYPGGQLPSHPGASYSDYDGDGHKNPFDPFPTDPTNYSSTNGIEWYGDVLGDADSDGTPNWDDYDPYPQPSDSDGDGIEDSSDPFPSDSSNYSYTNGISWYGDVFGDSDSDGTLNWDDPEPYGPSGSSDSDGDGIEDSSDPFPSDSSNYSSANGISWYGDVFGDADSDGTSNWNDSEPYGPSGSGDSDADGITDDVDPFPNDSNNYSSTNSISWYGDVLGDADSDGTPNWNDSEPYGVPDGDGDGITDDVDPYPSDSANYSSHNYVYWYGDVFGDADSDGTLNWEDSEPYGPTSPADSDGDGITDDVDPYPGDSANYSSTNYIAWYGDVLGDADSDGSPNWEDSDPYGSAPTDSDGDGLDDSSDPFPYDYTNYSSTNGYSWYGDVLGDADADGTLNWQDYEPYGPPVNNDADGDGIEDSSDPYPNDYANYSDVNYNYWYGNVLGDDDGDGTPNYADAWPNDPNNGTTPDPDYDGDGLTESQESSYGTSDWNVDCDGDGLSDYEELMVYSTDPLNPYTLSQGLGWGDLYNDYQLVDGTDTDGDGIPDRIEDHYGMLSNDAADGPGDLDGNGITNLVQYNAGLALNVDLNFYDADGDGMTDVFEDYYGLAKNYFADAMSDADSDGVLNFEESKLLTSPLVADTYASGGLGDLGVLMTAMLYPEGGEPTEDSDSDGIPDWQETALGGTSPIFTRAAANDLDADGMPDVWEHQYGRWKYPTNGLYVRHDDAAADADGDSLTNVQEYQAGTNPLISDTDGDGTSDNSEDADEDGVSNQDEFAHGLDPTNPDTDGDGIGDADEVAMLTDADLDGTNDDEEVPAGRDPNWKDHPAVELNVSSFSFP